MRTRAVQDGDSFIVNGTKRFITAAGRSDYVQLMALTDPEKRARGGITCFAVDLKSPGVVLERNWPTMMGEAPWQILFDNVRVPAANVIGAVGGGSSPEMVSEDASGNTARVSGIASAPDMMIEYLRSASLGLARRSTGDPVQDRRPAMELHATRLMVYERAWRQDQGETCAIYLRSR
jgi:acyl-CoA dehydrogenase